MQMIARNVPFEVEYRVVWPDGSIHHIAARGRVLRDNEGRPLRINGLVWDITPQKQAEEALRESEDRYRSLVENVGLGVTLIGADYRIRSVNPAQARLFGKAPEQLIGKECFREFEKRNSICPHCPGKIAMETGRPAETEQQGIHDDGLTHMARVQAYPMLDSSGRTTGVIAVTEDITQQRQLEAQYRQAQKMEAVGRLAAGVAHDFNNQLTIILGYCELLLKDGKGGDALREAMKQIHQAACRAQSTTSHLLSFSRKQILRPEVVDPGELLQEMRNPVSRMIGEDVQLQVVASPGVPSIFVDKSGLQQAIMNLVVNARDAMPKGGQLVIRTSRVELGQSDAAQYPEGRAGQWVLLEVIDTGVGMDRQTLDRVFDPFFTTKEVGKGTGLGAPMVQGFISQSHGFMGYATEVGKGTTVRLFLPPADSVVTQENAATVAPPASSKAKETILVVEDEEGVRQFIVRALQQQGYQIIEAASPAEALELVCQEACHFDLLVTDVVMPEMTGYELAERLKVGRKSLAVLFVTGYTDEPPTEGAMVLHKPFSLEKLMAGVEQSLASRRRRRKAT
jgi:PAS domain S-box-containing protein